MGGTLGRYRGPKVTAQRERGLVSVPGLVGESVS